MSVKPLPTNTKTLQIIVHEMCTLSELKFQERLSVMSGIFIGAIVTEQIYRVVSMIQTTMQCILF